MNIVKVISQKVNGWKIIFQKVISIISECRFSVMIILFGRITLILFKYLLEFIFLDSYTF